MIGLIRRLLFGDQWTAEERFLLHATEAEAIIWARTHVTNQREEAGHAHHQPPHQLAINGDPS